MTYIRIFLIVIYVFIISVLTLISALVDRGFSSYFKIAKAFGNGVIFLSGSKMKITGLENIDPNQTYVYVSNHASQFDIPIVQKAIPGRMSIAFKKELAKIPVFGWTLVVGPYVIIDRSNPEKAIKSIKYAIDLLKNKNVSILLFAEGTRSKDGQIQPFKRGAFNLAAKAAYPIIPVTISGSSKILPKGSFKLSKGELKVHFDKPIPADNIKSKVQELELMEKVRNIIISNHEG